MNTQAMVRDVAGLISGKPLQHFGDWHDLLGFRIGWMRSEEARAICARHGADPDECEIILMQAHSVTDCHLHMRGGTYFMVLGEEHGVPNPSGGILAAPFREDRGEYRLREIRQSAGDLFNLKPRVIHAFFADNGGSLTAIGVVHPKIRQDDGTFDVINFESIDGDPRHVRPAA